MTDENPTADKPLEVLTAKEQALEQALEQPSDAAARLRAFEDRIFGADAPRVDGDIERGHGSVFSKIDDDDRATHAALERLVEAEAKLKAANDAVVVAERDYADAAEAADRHADR